MNFFKRVTIYPNKQDLLNVLKKIVVYYLIFLSALFIFQRKIMYFPNTDTSISYNWIPIKNSYNNIIALQQKDIIHDYNVLIFHGNAGNADMKNYYKLLFPNANIFVAEYPGFGFRKNESLNKENIIKASEEIVENILKDKKPLILVGESLGSGVASEMAVKYHIQNLVLATPYNKIACVAQSKFPIFPIYPLVLDRYNNNDTLKNFHGNLVLLIAEFDNVIPTRFAYELSQSINPDIHKLEIVIKRSTHNSYVSSLTENDRIKMHQFLDLTYP